MTRTTVSQNINAPLEVVFKTVADIREFSQALPHVTKYEHLTDQKTGVGTRFRETRTQNGKDTETELEVTEYIENERVRMVADSHGTVWDTLFTTEQERNSVRLTLVMDAKAYQLMPRIINPLIKGMIKKAIEGDVELVKEFCESHGE